MKKSLLGRIFVTTAGVIGFSYFILILNLFTVPDLKSFDWITHPITGLVAMLLFAIPGVILLHRAKKTEKRTGLDLFALISGWVLIGKSLLFLGIMVLWAALFSLY